ncbi:MAG: type II toxin-antitoxin system Phd/YefM family antitoxin [Bacteroidia bacterium]|nr:type II toxin-antitoxin system Phd/YefM family antitoxin [Bacteroidia bacterium]
MTTLTVSKVQLKSHMQDYLRRVETDGDEFIVTSHNKPFCVIKPMRKIKSANEVFAPFRGGVHYDADLLEPESEEWELQ